MDERADFSHFDRDLSRFGHVFGRGYELEKQIYLFRAKNLPRDRAHNASNRLAIFVLLRASKAFGLNISKFNASLIVFSLWGVFEMMDIVRGAIVSIPRHQFESAAALALSKAQIYLYVVIPLATRRLVPAGVNLLSRIIKTTPIVALIGVPDLLKVGQQTIETASLTANPTVPFWIYGFIFLLYFLVCYPISKLSKILENRWA